MHTRRIVSSLGGVLLLALVAGGCSDSRSGPPPGSLSGATASPSTSATQTATPTATPSFNPNDPLSAALRLDIAREFAPRLRFNAYHNDGNTRRQNTNEDYFPMSVSTFFRELASGQTRVVVVESAGTSPAVSEVRQSASTPGFGADQLVGYPRRMVGDAPGSAAVYVHVYEDTAARVLTADGSGEMLVYAEFWLFYAHDRADATILGIACTQDNDYAGHRADWEHTSFRIRVRLGPGATLTGGDLEEGYFYGHGDLFTVEANELERVDDAGRPAARGTHPVVYVAQGKHASYPQAGEWEDGTFPPLLGNYTDFFRGNGVVVDTWQGRLVDLEDPIAAPGEFDTPEFHALFARASLPAPITDWTRYTGRWGPDDSTFNVPLLGSFTIGRSPDGPKNKGSYGDFGGPGRSELWRDAKAQSSRLRVYADLGISIPQANPVPVPVRR